VRVLDPACGSGNFLYVTLEHLKRLEGEVLNLLHDLGESQGLLELEGVTVDPHQFLGLEINPRAARIAEMVLWIGYLQWHVRTHGSVNPPEPVLRDFRNIQHRDALIEYEREEPVTDEAGRPVTRWDGVTYRKSPITGEDIPDEVAQVVQMRYVNPRKAEWPQADYIVGNPPFIGGWKLRAALGDGYVETLWSLYPDMPQKADFVMYWWDIAAGKVRHGDAHRFGFITTNSITQVFQRRILERHISRTDAPLSLAYAIPDHPWVDAADGAAVRIAMTVGAAGNDPGQRLEVITEANNGGDQVDVQLLVREGLLHADLKIGANVASAVPLQANAGICSPGVQLYGSGFVLEPEKAAHLLALTPPTTTQPIIRPYVNGRDLVQASRGCSVIDFFGLDEEGARLAHPAAYQHVLDYVKPERALNRRESIRRLWWRFGWERPKLREMTLAVRRYISTPETASHRIFCFIDSTVLPDNRLTNIAVEDALGLGVFSGRIHVLWALAAGGTLEDRPIYTKSTCFDPFPFPDPTPAQAARIRDLAEQLDAHRKRQQAQHPELTLTGMYNVLEKLRAGDTLTPKERTIHEQGLVSVLRELHDALDTAVFEAYGWGDLAAELVGKPGATTPLPDKPEAQAAAEEELLRRLVELNAARAAEEARGLVRWLRPDYQNPGAAQTGPGGAAPEQLEAELEGGAAAAEVDADALPAAAPAAGKATWPKNMREQVAAVRAALAHQPLPAEAIAARFKRTPRAGVQAVLEALEELGMVVREDGAYRLQG